MEWFGVPRQAHGLEAFRSNATALLGKAALFISGCRCNYSVVPSDFDGLVRGYRLT